MEIFIKNSLVLVVALLHIYILVLEMFLWTRPIGLKAFRMNQEKANQTSVLAANQGLYNGFLAAGLIWSLFYKNSQASADIAVFFLACVLIAAAYGGLTVGKKILFIQGTPALLALLAICFL